MMIQRLLFYGSIGCMNTITQPVIYWVLHSLQFATHIPSSPETLQKFLTTFWTSKTGWEMTSRLNRWPLLEPLIVRWRNNVSVRCSSRDCERFASLYSLHRHRCPVHFYYFQDSPCNNLAYGSSTPVAMGGSVVGLAPPNKAPSPPNWNIKHYKSESFCQFLECPASPQKCKDPYWKLSGGGSGLQVRQQPHLHRLQG